MNSIFFTTLGHRHRESRGNTEHVSVLEEFFKLLVFSTRHQRRSSESHCLVTVHLYVEGSFVGWSDLMPRLYTVLHRSNGSHIRVNLRAHAFFHMLLLLHEYETTHLLDKIHLHRSFMSTPSKTNCRKPGWGGHFEVQHAIMHSSDKP